MLVILTLYTINLYICDLVGGCATALLLMGDLNSDELSLPKATVQKIVAEIMPPDLMLSREARDALIECCVMFIMILSTESNEVAEKESKKTIACEHVSKALERLGFSDYIEPITKVIAAQKDNQKQRERKVGKLERSGRTEEELLEEQERLIAESRKRMLGIQEQNNAEVALESEHPGSE